MVHKTRFKKHKKRIYFLYIIPILGICAVLYYLFIYKAHINPPKSIAKEPSSVVLPTFTPKPLHEMKIPIIMYHYVEYVKDKGDTIRQSLNINPYLFEKQLSTLQDNGYESYFVKDIPSIMNSGHILDNKSIVLTFDDGYEDFYENAYPLLKKYQFKATVYVITEAIDTRGFLKKDQITEMIDSGLIEIGSHTLHHVGLMSTEHELARREIIDSKKNLEDMFNVPIVSFAYPGGFYDQQAISLVKEAGYTIALTTKPGIHVKRQELFEVPRIRAGYLSVSQIESSFENIPLK